MKNRQIGKKDAERDYVWSKDLKEKHYIGNTWENSIIDKVECPIDHTELVSTRDYDSHDWRCFACKAWYPPGCTDEQRLREYAEKYISELRQKVSDGECKVNELPRLEKIIKAAERNGIMGRPNPAEKKVTR